MKTKDKLEKEIEDNFEEELQKKKRKSIYDKCKCGNIKTKFAKSCSKCFHSNKLKGKTRLWKK